MLAKGNLCGRLLQMNRSLRLTDKGWAATDPRDDDHNPLGPPVPPRCHQCQRALGQCPGHGNARLPDRGTQ